MALIIGKHAGGETLDYSDGITDGNDQIVGNAGVDHIYAGGGQDIIKGGGGADVIDGGAGRDGASYEDSDVGVQVSLVTGKGHGGTAEGDTLISIEDLYGSKHDDQLTGDSGDNLLSGNDGNDTLKGGGGTDVLKGGAGNDVMEIDGVEDHADGGDGIDTLVVKSAAGLSIDLSSGFVDANPYGGYYGNHHYGYGPYAHPHVYGETPQLGGIENVIGSSQNDDIRGTDGANSLFGGNGDDVVMGRGGDDILDGGNGSDVIFAGTGADTVSGGTGFDTFVWTAVNESVFAGGKPQDMISDFETGYDKIDLSWLDIPVNDFLAIDNQNLGGVNYSFVGIDANHNGQFDDGEFAIAVKMTPGTVLHMSDFIL